MKKTVLCIELGSFGGGSAESLYTHIKSLKDQYNFICIFAVKNRFSKKIESLGVKVHYFYNSFFNAEYTISNKLISKLYNLFYKLTFSSFLTLHTKIDYWFNKKFYDWIDRLITQLDIDIIHTNNQANRDFNLFNLAYKHNIKVVSHIRTFNTYGFSYEKAQVANKLVSHFITYSSFLKEVWSECGLDSGKISVVPNALFELTNEELELAVQPINILEDAKGYTKLLLLGRIIPERGHLFAFKVLKKLLQKGRKVKLYIVGGYQGFEDYYKSLQIDIEKNNLGSYIVFTGFFEHPHQFIKNSDILFMPYTIEPFGRVLLEAWQLEVPVVLSNVGNISEIVDDKQNGLLFNNGDVKACIALIEQLIDNKDGVVDKLIKNGNTTYQDKYTPKSYSLKIVEIYKKVLAK